MPETYLPRTLFLPVDIVLDILSRLPVKSIRRFCCVSHKWHASLSDPSFRSLHSEVSRKNPLFIYYTSYFPQRRSGYDCCCSTCVSYGEDEDDEEYFFPLIPKPPPPTFSFKIEDKTGMLQDEFHIFNLDSYGAVSVISSGRELICLRRKERTLYVKNPTTNQMLKLPKPEESHRERIDYFSLTYVPSLDYYTLLHVYITVYDEDDTDFIVSQMLDIKPGEKPGRWRFACESFPSLFKSNLMILVQNVDAAAFWYTKPDPKLLEFDHVVCFDCEKKVCLPVEKPQGCSDSFGPLTSLVGLKGCLSLIDVVKDNASMTMDIWLLKDFRNSVWQKEYSLNMSSIGINYILPMHFGEREIIFHAYFTSGGSRMRSYDMFTKTWSTGGKLSSSGEIGPLLYFEGLYPLAGVPYFAGLVPVADGATT